MMLVRGFPVRFSRVFPVTLFEAKYVTFAQMTILPHLGVDYSTATKSLITLVLSTACEQHGCPAVRVGSCCARAIRLLAL